MADFSATVPDELVRAPDEASRATDRSRGVTIAPIHPVQREGQPLWLPLQFPICGNWWLFVDGRL